jgi:hypothetical protein
MAGLGRVAAGAWIGAAVAGAISPFLKPLFDVPANGVGFTTLNAYPKGWDYAVVALLVLGAFMGGMLSRGATAAPEVDSQPRGRGGRRSLWVITVVVFVLMLFVHDHPYAFMDPFHEGEHLTPGFLFRSGERPFRDVFVLHGLATDGGLDALVLGDPPSPRRARRLQTVLDAATLALLVPIAAELVTTTGGLVAAVFASLCATAAFWVPVFPYFRLAPVLVCVLAMLRYVRTRRWPPLLVAFASASAGLLWSLDTGTYALAATAITAALIARRRAVVLLAFLAPLLLLPRQFWADSFVIIPRAIDAVWSLPAPGPFTAAGARYFLPPVFYGFLLALAWRRRDARLAVVAIFSLLLFRTATGRVSWSHTRYAAPLHGIAAVAFVVEPLLLARRRAAGAIAAVALIVWFEAGPNILAGARLLAAWPSRQRHEGLVPYPFATGKGIYTTEQNARELAALNGMIASHGTGTFLDFTNERALYYLLQRKPPLRCFDIPMLSNPRLFSEAMGQLNAHPPDVVVLGGDPNVSTFDGLPNHVRVPALAAWIDANYPRRYEVGRFVVAAR